MANERLRDALAQRGLSPLAVSQRLGVDSKTVQRWVGQARTPYPKHRAQLSALLQEPETWLWPDSVTPARQDAASRSEVVQIHPRRSSIGGDEWLHLFSAASTFVDVLVYAGLVLPEQTPTIIELIRSKGADGARVRMLLGDPEGIGSEAVATKVRNSPRLLQRPLYRAPGVQVRLHRSTLYTSIYRSDDTMIANPHVLGLPAAQAPAIHLRRLSAGGLFDTYASMYDRVWDEAVPAWT